MPPLFLSMNCFRTRLLILTPVDIVVLVFLVLVFIVAVVFRKILVLVVIASSFIICCSLIYILKLRKEEKTDTCDANVPPEEEKKYSIIEVPGFPIRFSFEELKVATKDFQEMLGAGGFGSVFKGILNDGTMVAVKRLERKSKDMKEFLAEVKSLGSIHHFNLVKLIGYCKNKSYQLLVYEFVANGSLDKWIFNKDPKHYLNWQIRKRIAIDIAKGLAYLHEGCSKKIIHLDVKPENILLDENFNAKVSDFGMSKLIDRDESQVVTTIRGTPGYIAPEWRHSRITVKVDIYSFGVVLLEMICGRRNLDRDSQSSSHLLRLLQRKSNQNKLLDIVRNLDEDMQMKAEEVERMIRVAAWCLQNDHTRRPSMSNLVNVLAGEQEMDSNISFNFIYALEDRVLDIGDVSSSPEASTLRSIADGTGQRI